MSSAVPTAPPGATAAPPRPGWRAVLGLALALTLLNALKPLHMDDPGFHHFAQQAAEHPGSPYGFELIWDYEPRHALEILAPPVVPYWWGLGMRLFGDRPWCWKLWLFPVCLLLVASLRALLRRFVRRHEGPLLVLLAVSPVVLPGLNLMSDIPALALHLAALAVFLAACDRASLRGAALAGLLAGAAMQ